MLCARGYNLQRMLHDTACVIFSQKRYELYCLGRLSRFLRGFRVDRSQAAQLIWCLQASEHQCACLQQGTQLVLPGKPSKAAPWRLTVNLEWSKLREWQGMDLICCEFCGVFSQGRSISRASVAQVRIWMNQTAAELTATHVVSRYIARGH